MATKKETVEYVLEQLAPLPVRARAMFGEYGVYCDEKFVALICDDTLFVKPTAVGEAFFGADEMAPPYAGAKDHYAVAEERLADGAWLREVVSRTAEALPAPKPKRAGKKRG